MSFYVVSLTIVLVIIKIVSRKKVSKKITELDLLMEGGQENQNEVNPDKPEGCFKRMCNRIS